MKKLLILVLTFLANGAFALDANISYATFKTEGGNYIEIWLHIVGKSAEFVKLDDSLSTAKLEVVILFKQNGAVVKFDKYALESPAFRKPADFIDLKRYGLPNGQYDLEVSIEDLNRKDNAATFNTTVKLDYPDDRLAQSDIQLLASIQPAGEGKEKNPMVRGGYIFENLPGNFYGRRANVLMFYNEIYNADKAIGEDYVVSYSIEKETGEGKAQTVSIGHKRRSCEKICSVMQSMDISQLASGNYHLVVEVRNKNKEVLSRKAVFFQRSNPLVDAIGENPELDSASMDEEFVGKLKTDELAYSLKAIFMLVGPSDSELMNLLIKEKKAEAMRMYLFHFWAKEYPSDPQTAYEEYMKVARAIDERYRNGFRLGFETDRGYIFLKYGAPNDIVPVETELDAPPYEVWSYNQFPATGQHNVRFLFYNPTLVNNGHVLLHSTARGEINNPRWEYDLYRDASPGDVEGGDYIDGTKMNEKMGRYARQLMKDF